MNKHENSTIHREQKKILIALLLKRTNEESGVIKIASEYETAAT